jgi:hypothetical protein
MDHQAFAQLLGNYGEFIGAIAVVATLFYLAIQVRHGQEATEANTRSVEESRRVALVDSYVRRLEAMERAQIQLALSDQLSDIVRRTDADGVDSLTETERLRLFRWEHARLCRVESQFYQWQHGLLDDEYYENQFKFIVRRAAPLWEELDLEIARPSLRAAVQEVLAEYSSSQNTVGDV